MAPAMIYKCDIVCGHSIEINFVSNVQVNLSLQQMTLVSDFYTNLQADLKIVRNNLQNMRKFKTNFPYKHLIKKEQKSTDGYQNIVDAHKDSGFETCDLRSNISFKHKVTNTFRLCQTLFIQKFYLFQVNSQIRKVSESEKSSTNVQSSIISNVGFLNYNPLDILITSGKFCVVLYKFENSNEPYTFSNKRKTQLREVSIMNLLKI